MISAPKTCEKPWKTGVRGLNSLKSIVDSNQAANAKVVPPLRAAHAAIRRAEKAAVIDRFFRLLRCTARSTLRKRLGYSMNNAAGEAATPSHPPTGPTAPGRPVCAPGSLPLHNTADQHLL